MVSNLRISVSETHAHYRWLPRDPSTEIWNGANWSFSHIERELSFNGIIGLSFHALVIPAEPSQRCEQKRRKNAKLLDDEALYSRDRERGSIAEKIGSILRNGQHGPRYLRAAIQREKHVWWCTPFSSPTVLTSLHARRTGLDYG